MRLERMPYANAKIVITEENGYKFIVLVSYNTNVAVICETGHIACYGLYSRTTRRHISAFARQFGLEYGDFKAVYERDAVGIPLVRWDKTAWDKYIQKINNFIVENVN